jgi:hypothetical protein
VTLILFSKPVEANVTSKRRLRTQIPGTPVQSSKFSLSHGGHSDGGPVGGLGGVQQRRS